MPTGLGDEQLWISATNDNTGSSTAFNDQSGNGRDCTPNGGMLVVADTSEGGTYAFDFDEVDDYMTKAGGIGTGTTDAFCIAFWWNWTTGSTQYVWDMDYTENNALSLVTKSSPTRIQAVARPNSSGSGNTYMNVALNTWQHIVYQRVAGSNQIKSYVNGVEHPVVRAAPDPITLGNDLTIGGAEGGIVLFGGKLDDIRWYNKSLTQAEIIHLASARGVEGPPPVGLGDEQLWLCPSLNDSPNDISGNGNNGTYVNGVSTVADSDPTYGGSRAYNLDGTNDYIDISGFAVATSSYSVSMWVNITSPAQTTFIFNTGRSSDGHTVSTIRMRYDGVILAGYFDGSSYYATSTSSVRNVGWKHLLYTYDGTNLELFVDGVSEDTITSVPNPSATQPLGYIGRWVSGNSADRTAYWTTGKMDDIRAYNRTLTQAEIAHLAEARGIEGLPSGGSSINVLLLGVG